MHGLAASVCCAMVTRMAEALGKTEMEAIAALNQCWALPRSTLLTELLKSFFYAHSTGKHNNRNTLNLLLVLFFFLTHKLFSRKNWSNFLFVCLFVCYSCMCKWKSVIFVFCYCFLMFLTYLMLSCKCYFTAPVIHFFMAPWEMIVRGFSVYLRHWTCWS